MKFLVCLALIFNLSLAIELQNIQADFIQTINGEDGHIKYSGNLMASADSMAYWHYKTPFKKEIFVNKNQVTIYEPNLNQAIISKKINVDFIKIINSVKESKNGLISEVNGQIFQIFLKDDKPYKILYTDELDNKIEIILENVKINQKIDNKMFSFSIPEDTDVIFE